MMKYLLSLLLVLSFAFANDTEKLYIQSGAKESIAMIPVMIKQGMEEQKKLAGKGVPAGVTAKLDALAGKFDVNKMNKLMLKYLGKYISNTDTKNILKWIQTPLGKKIIRAEITSSSIDASKTLEAYMKTFNPATTLSQKRATLLKKFRRISKMDEKGIDMVLNISVAAAKSFMDHIPKEQRPSFAQVKAMMKQQMDGQLSAMKQMFYASMAFTYAKVSDSEFSSYIDFLMTKSGKAYLDGSLNSINDTFMDIVKTF